MSKHDNYSKIEEIRRYYSDEDYMAAVELADSVDWPGVKSWDALAMMTDAYENLGEFENARDMAILAYNRNLGGKKLVYRLTELLIKTGDLEEAEETFNEYCQMSRNAPDSYILEYHLLREKKAPDSELIRVLEEFKEAGPDERYMYRLAELYAKNGEADKCAAVCDNIALWFKDGDFAEGAVKLKKKVGAELSPEQEKLYNAAKVKDEDLAKTSKVDFKGQIDTGVNDAQNGEKIGAGAAATAAAGGAAAGGAAGKLKSFVKNVFNDEDFDEDEFDRNEAAASAAAAAAAGAAAGAVAGAASDKAAEKTVAAGVTGDADKGDALADTAKESVKHEIDPEIKKNLSAEVSEELDNESALRGDGVISGEKQIDGQLNMNDWMTDVREKKYGGQSTKEYSKTELERMLEEKNEKSEAYDRLMAEQKKLAEEKGTPFNEASAKLKVEQQLAIDAARRDLDIRTGKGTARQESATEAIAAQSFEERPQEETLLGAVLEAAGTEAVRESAGTVADPSERMLRIESAVLSMLGANLSERIAVRGDSAPKEVVNAAAILVKYISGEYEELNKAAGVQAAGSAATVKPDTNEDNIVPEEIKKAAGVAAHTEVQEETETAQSGKSKMESGFESPAGIKKDTGTAVKKDNGKAIADDSPEALDKAAEAKAVSEKQNADSKERIAPSITGAAVAAGAAAAAAGTAGVLHEKAKRAKEIFSGEAAGVAAAGSDSGKEKQAQKKAEPKVSEQAKAEAEAIKEIQKTNALKPGSMQEETLTEEPAAKVPEEKEPERISKKDRNTGKTPDLRKMRLNKVTAEDVEANLTEDEAALAQRITSDDHAVDIITARITGQLNTAEVERALAESEKDDIKIEDGDTFTDTTHIDKKMLREIIETSEGDEESEGKNTRRFDTTAKQDTAQLDNVLREDLPKGKREKIKSMFDEYYDMPEIDAQIEEYIASLPVEITREDSRNGNIIIAGAESVDKTGLAKTIAKAVNISYPKKKKKVIRTTGDSLNEYGFARSADKLRGTFLVIEKVGLLRPDIISEIVDVMRKDTDRMIVIAEDTDAGIESFLNTNPALPKLFNHRINMRPFTTEELVEIAKDLASQKGFTVSDEGALALYLEIDELRASEPKVTIDDMDALTDDAISHAKRRIKKETGVSVKKMDSEFCVLTNEDFRY